METREHLNQLVETWPDASLETAARLLRSLLEPVKAVTLLFASELGRTPEQDAETRVHLASFAEDWDAPGLEGDDKL